MKKLSPTPAHGPHVGAAKKHPLLVALVLLIVGVAAGAHAATTVKVLATDPPGGNVMLDRNQNFYVRIGYTTDEPVKHLGAAVFPWLGGRCRNQSVADLHRRGRGAWLVLLHETG